MVKKCKGVLTKLVNGRPRDSLTFSYYCTILNNRCSKEFIRQRKKILPPSYPHRPSRSQVDGAFAPRVFPVSAWLKVSPLTQRRDDTLGVLREGLQEALSKSRNGVEDTFLPKRPLYATTFARSTVKLILGAAMRPKVRDPVDVRLKVASRYAGEGRRL
jgi:hypothetical protein